MYLENLRYRLRLVVDGLVIITVNAHTWVVDPIVMFGACDPTFIELRIPVLTVKALGIVIIVNYLIAIITSIFENCLSLSRSFFPLFHTCLFLSWVQIEICYYFFSFSNSFAATNSFLCSEEVRIGVLHLFRDTLFLSCSMFGIGIKTMGLWKGKIDIRCSSVVGLQQDTSFPFESFLVLGSSFGAVWDVGLWRACVYSVVWNIALLFHFGLHY